MVIEDSPYENIKCLNILYTLLTDQRISQYLKKIDVFCQKYLFNCKNVKEQEV